MKGSGRDVVGRDGTRRESACVCEVILNAHVEKCSGWGIDAKRGRKTNEGAAKCRWRTQMQGRQERGN